MQLLRYSQNIIYKHLNSERTRLSSPGRALTSQFSTNVNKQKFSYFLLKKEKKLSFLFCLTSCLKSYEKVSHFYLRPFFINRGFAVFDKLGNDLVDVNAYDRGCPKPSQDEAVEFLFCIFDDNSSNFDTHIGREKHSQLILHAWWW